MSLYAKIQIIAGHAMAVVADADQRDIIAETAGNAFIGGVTDGPTGLRGGLSCQDTI